ncbi:fructose 1-phosphate kinase [Oceanobacillus iheyensis HTE831]|uniref:Tagatose-6-phosphate kinase n=1 Tax=Oceanobacillus iheyensis (strain DSM 14371 / CIP 107618 / JCM 11309 / KCTC 3954 / HTE831) TaxID=221109 RepID=Q8ES06_OCEIH|nr:1-phosphofructokinase [Oceanobacillus iheyensis]BAC12795.1 fructose 1-phosphate kinase [Oceanobacillus iheyensis HTE831]
MIYTITLNPSIDFIVPVDQLKLGKLNYMNDEYKVPGGKGINVSRILQELTTSSTALGFIGGFTGNFIIDFLEKRNLKTDFISISEDTRINIKLKSSSETEINGRGPSISSDESSKLLSQLEKITANDFVVLSGSKPPSLPADFYEKVIKKVTETGARFAIDTTGDALMQSLAYQPLVIKPNQHELEDLFGVTISTNEDVIKYGKKLLKKGAQHVIVSMGADGAILITNNGVYKGTSPSGTLRNSVGAGDSMIAGFLSIYLTSQNVLEAFKMSIAAGSATAFSHDLATRNKIDNLLSEIEITTL